MIDCPFSHLYLLQEYDLSQLHRESDNRPEVFCTEAFPSVQSRLCRRLQDNEEIGDFLEDVSHIKRLTWCGIKRTSSSYKCVNIYRMYQCNIYCNATQ